jgi:hypothetical protein
VGQHEKLVRTHRERHRSQVEGIVHREGGIVHQEVRSLGSRVDRKKLVNEMLKSRSKYRKGTVLNNVISKLTSVPNESLNSFRIRAYNALWEAFPCHFC